MCITHWFKLPISSENCRCMRGVQYMHPKDTFSSNKYKWHKLNEQDIAA